MSKSGQFILHTAPRRHGRPHAGVRPHPRRHHGRGRHLHGLPALRGLLGGPVDRHVQHQPPRARRRGDRVGWGRAGVRAVRHQAGPRVLHGLAARLHGDGPRCGRLDRRCSTCSPAFFKACLFLGSGSVSHSVHSFDMQEMGGLRKPMPQTYKTFVIATGAPHRHLPVGRLLVEGRDPGGRIAARRRRQLQDLHGRRHHRRPHDRRLHGAVRVPHLLRRVPGSWPSPRVGPRIVVPLWILATLGVFAGLVNLPSALAPDSVELRFEHYYEPVGAFPSIVPSFAHPEFSWASRS